MLYVDVVTGENDFIIVRFKELGYHIFYIMALLY